MIPNNEPIYCSLCGRLALANLGNRPLCPGCLTQAISASDDPLITGKISPLFKTTQLSHIVKCKKENQLAPQVSLKTTQNQSAYKY